MKKRIFLLCFLIGFITFSSQASVNVQTASWTEEVVDWESSDKIFQLKRRYDSRSLHLGFIGVGWCSNLERNLTPDAGGRSLRLRSCWNDQDDVFLRTRSFQDGGAIFSRSGTNETIYAHRGRFHWLSRAPEGVEEESIFDAKGRWVEWRSGRHHLKIEYREGTVPSRLHINGSVLEFSMDSAGRQWRSVRAPDRKLDFSYLGLNLKSVSSDRNDLTVTYRYDDFHNLTEIHDALGERVSVLYDSENDRVVGVLNGICVEKYHYGDQSRGYEVRILVECPGRPLSVVTYRFLRGPGSELRLGEFQVVRGSTQFLVQYDQKQRWRRAELRQAQQKWSMDWDALGRMTARQGAEKSQIERRGVAAFLNAGGL